MNYKSLFFIITVFFLGNPLSLAETYHCEVAALKGDVQSINSEGKARALKSGDILTNGETVVVPLNSHIDLALDKGWQNIVRINEDSKVKISSLLPADLHMDYGNIFAVLHKLPKHSTFEIRTPAAIAGVRGSALEVDHRNDLTTVSNFDDSTVWVFDILEDNNIGDPILLDFHEQIEIPLHEPASDTEGISKDEIHRNEEIQNMISENVKGRMDDMNDYEATIPTDPHIGGETISYPMDHVSHENVIIDGDHAEAMSDAHLFDKGSYGENDNLSETNTFEEILYDGDETFVDNELFDGDGTIDNPPHEDRLAGDVDDDIDIETDMNTDDDTDDNTDDDTDSDSDTVIFFP